MAKRKFIKMTKNMKKDISPIFIVDISTGSVSFEYEGYQGRRIFTDWKLKKVGKSTKTND